METLFNLHLLRPAVTPDPRYPAIRLAQDSAFQEKLSQGGIDPINGRDLMNRAADEFLSSALFVQLDPQDAGNKPLDAVTELLESKAKASDTASDPAIDRTKLRQSLEDALNQSIELYVNDSNTATLLSRLKDSIVAIKQLGAESPGHLETLARRLHAIDFLQKLHADSQFPISGGDLARWWRRPLLAPTLADFQSILSSKALNDRQEQDRLARLQQLQEQAKSAYSQYRALVSAKNALGNLPSTLLQTTPPVAARAFQPPDSNYTKSSLMDQHLNLLTAYTDLSRKHYDLVLQRGSNDQPDTQRAFEIAGAESLVKMSQNLFSETRQITPQTGVMGFTPTDPNTANGTLSSAAFEVVPPGILSTIKDRGHSLTGKPLHQIVGDLESGIAAVTATLNDLYSQNSKASQATAQSIGGITIKPAQAVAALPWHIAAAGGLDVAPLLGALEPPDVNPALIPHTHGKVTVAGVADLLVVKQQLIRYEGADVASIESILLGEQRSQEITTRQEIEQFTSTETETDTTEEKDLTKADRFETSTESQKAIKDNESLKAGLTLSGSYGPSVKFVASASGSLDRSKDESTKTATKYSQDVTQKASSKIQQRVLQRTSLKVTTEVVNKAVHTFDNRGGEDNINGVYQWVTKIYEAQIYNYGLRTMLDFMLPEPGAFLFNGPNQGKSPTPTVTIQEVPRVPDTPDEIDEKNYVQLANTLGATDIDPPPSLFARTSANHNEPSLPVDTTTGHSESIKIADGYGVFFISVQIVSIAHYANDSQGSFAVGSFGSAIDISQGHKLYSALGDLRTDSITMQVVTRNMASYSIAVDLILMRTGDALNAWRRGVWNKLKAAQKAMQQDHDAKIAAAQASLAAQSWAYQSSSNPEANLATMRTEIKKMCITLITNQQFDIFNGVEKGSKNVTQLSFDAARSQGPYIRFFEEAFEWDQMTWLTYPYFWGDKSNWFSKLAYVDADPVFQDFMRAGSARASVPVRPGFEGAIDHFLSSGDVWMGGPLPSIGSELFLSIITEISERLGKKEGEEEPVGDPWEVRVPTSLISLRQDDKLPTWEKVDGVWKPTEDKPKSHSSSVGVGPGGGLVGSGTWTGTWTGTSPSRAGGGTNTGTNS